MISKRELVLNSINMLKLFKHHRPTDRLQAVIFMFDQADPEGSATCAASVDNDQIVAVCRGILRKLDRSPDSIIIHPRDA